MKTYEILTKKTKDKLPEWAMKEQADFCNFVFDFGFTLMTAKPKKSNIDTDMIIGGGLKDQDDNELLDKEHRLMDLKKGLAQYLLNKAKQGRVVKIFKYGYWQLHPQYIHPEDNIRAAEYAVNNTVYFTPAHLNPEKTPLSIRWSISEPKA